MSKQQHTPGPWHIELAMAQGGESHHICDDRDMQELSVIATVHFHDDAEGETKANARLIAAAPELFDLLEMMAEGTLITWEPGNPYKTPLDVLHTYQRMARAAIAKATGA